MFHAYCIVTNEKKVRDEYIKTQLITNKIHVVDTLDFLSLEKIGITEARKLIAFLQLKPFTSSHKVVMIEGDVLSTDAQQALLKTFEEPPQNSLLFVGVSQKENLLPTLQSRCLPVYLDTPIREPHFNTEIQLPFWKELIAQKPIARLLRTGDLPKDRDKFEIWLTEQLYYLQHVLYSTITSASHTLLEPKELTLVLRNLLSTLSLLKRNVSTKLLLDHLLLSIPFKE